MPMSQTLLRPRRRAAVPPPPVEGSAPSAPTGISLTTAPLVPTAITLTTAPSPPLSPSLATAPDSPTGVTVETGLVAPTNVGLLAAPKNLTATEVFAPDAPTGLDLTAAPASPTGVQLSVVPSEPTSVTVASVPGSPTGVGLLGSPSNLVVTEGSAPDSPTSVQLTTAPTAPTGPQLTTAPSSPTGVTATGAAALDPYFSSVSLLLQDSLADQSPQGQTIVANGDAAISTSVSKFGGASLAFDGTGDYLAITDNAALDFTDGNDFTIEFWFYRSGTSGSGLFGRGGGAASWSTSNGHYYLFFIQSGTLYAQYNYGAGPSTPISLTTTAPSVSNWHHFAIVRSSGTITAYLNGTSFGSSAAALVAPTTRNITRIGDQPSGSGVWNGYVDDFRITKGVARYAANFTPPTQAFPATNGDPYFSSVSLLLQDSLADQSQQGQTVVANGDAAISTSVSKFGGASLAFDGNGDYLSVPDDASLNFGSEDFTIECWLYVLDRTNTTSSAFVSKGVVASLVAAQFWSFQLTPTGVLTFFAHSNSAPTVAATSVIAENQWLHVAVCRSGNTHRLFVDGVLINTQTHSYTQSAGGNVYVGTQWFDPGASARSFNGYIDDFRITKGVARYAANFTPPTSAFPS